jgi:hypothetical protein
MNTKDDDVIPSIWRHNNSVVRGYGLGENFARGTVRTRGDILTRDALVPDSAFAAKRSIYLDTLIELLRKQVGELPLTLLLHDWGSKPATYFLSLLSTFLRKVDAVWLVISEEMLIQTLPPKMAGAALLKLSQDTDARIYENLVYDIVFFPALDQVEVEQVARLKKRSRAIIIDYNSPLNSAVARASFEAMLMTYLWFGQGNLIEYTGDASDSYASDLEDGGETRLESIGEIMKATARHLENVYDRRRKFQSRIKKVLATHLNYPKLNETLVRQADRANWPSWAVECLPTLYVPTETLTLGRISALVWHQILECVPEHLTYEVVAKLCNGQIYEVRTDEETASFLNSIAQIFENHLRHNPFESERSFTGAITSAIQEIELRYPQAARKSLEIRKDVLTEDDII